MPSTIKTLYYPTDAQIYNSYIQLELLKNILKYLKLLKHVSDHKGSIIRELYTMLG